MPSGCRGQNAFVKLELTASYIGDAGMKRRTTRIRRDIRPVRVNWNHSLVRYASKVHSFAVKQFNVRPKILLYLSEKQFGESLTNSPDKTAVAHLQKFRKVVSDERAMSFLGHSTVDPFAGVTIPVKVGGLIEYHILINPKSARPTTLPEEVGHAVLFEVFRKKKGGKYDPIADFGKHQKLHEGLAKAFADCYAEKNGAVGSIDLSKNRLAQKMRYYKEFLRTKPKNERAVLKLEKNELALVEHDLKSPNAHKTIEGRGRIVEYYEEFRKGLFDEQELAEAIILSAPDIDGRLRTIREIIDRGITSSTEAVLYAVQKRMQIIR